jgi:hypothetical protein
MVNNVDDSHRDSFFFENLGGHERFMDHDPQAMTATSGSIFELIGFAQLGKSVPSS